MVFLGGCLCGNLRYKSEQSALNTGYCHCLICRKSTSAPVVAFASFSVDDFSYTNGVPSVYQSSSTGQREFCGKCGAQICHRGTVNSKTVDVNSGTLDNMELVSPQFHIYTKDSVSWFKINDQLPRYAKGAG